MRNRCASFLASAVLSFGILLAGSGCSHFDDTQVETSRGSTTTLTQMNEFTVSAGESEVRVGDKLLTQVEQSITSELTGKGYQPGGEGFHVSFSVITQSVVGKQSPITTGSSNDAVTATRPHSHEGRFIKIDANRRGGGALWSVTSPLNSGASDEAGISAEIAAALKSFPSHDG